MRIERGQPKFRRTNPPAPNSAPSLSATLAFSRKNVKGSGAAGPALRQSSHAKYVASGGATATPGRRARTYSTTKSRLASRYLSSSGATPVCPSPGELAVTIGGERGGVAEHVDRLDQVHAPGDELLAQRRVRNDGD